MTSSIRVATTGTGYFSQFQYEAWTRLEEVEVVAVVNRTEENGRRIAEAYGIPGVFTDLDEMLETVKPDLLDIITPPVTHLDAIRAGARHRVPMICQKPFCQTLAEAEEAVRHRRGGRHPPRDPRELPLPTVVRRGQAPA